MPSNNLMIHNVKFYKPQVRAISCIRLQRKLKLLALSRSDNSVEIWNVQHTPAIIKWIPREGELTVEQVQWCGDRLFSCGLQGTIVEYDLLNECIKQSTSVTGGAAWCLDFCENNNLVAVGTEEGYINIFTVTEYGLEFFKFMDKQQGRVLCMCWDYHGKYLVTGSSDVVRVWNLATGHAMHKMATGRRQNNRETIVWSLAVTKDLTIISGDSRGVVTFWDGKLGVQTENINSHAADILSVALSEDEKTVFCAGVDPVVVACGRVSDRVGGGRKWARGFTRRVHQHDVRSLAAVDNTAVYSAGVDGCLVYTRYPPRIRIRCPPLLKGPCIQLLKELRLVLLRDLEQLRICKLGSPMNGMNTDESALPLATKPVCLLRLSAPSESSIVCASLSMNGRYVAYSTETSLRFFVFDIAAKSVSRILGSSDDCPCKLIQFYSEEEKHLCVAVSRTNNIHVFQLSDQGAEEVHSFKPSQSSALTDSILLATISPTGKVLVLADCCGRIASWSTVTWEVLVNLPFYNAVPKALTVDYNDNSIYVAYSDHKIAEFLIHDKKYSEFSSNIKTRLSTALNTAANGIVLDPECNDRLLVHDYSNICGIVKEHIKQQNPPSKVVKLNNSSEATDVDELGINVIKAYKFIVAMEWIDKDELVLVETSPVKLSEELPPTLKKKQFGK